MKGAPWPSSTGRSGHVWNTLPSSEDGPDIYGDTEEACGGHKSTACAVVVLSLRSRSRSIVRADFPVSHLHNS
jgi:hypothetical protein